MRVSFWMVFMVCFFSLLSKSFGQFNMPQRDYREEDTLKNVLVISSVENPLVPRLQLEPRDMIKVKSKATGRKYQGKLFAYNDYELEIETSDGDYIKVPYQDVAWIRFEAAYYKSWVRLYEITMGAIAVGGLGYGVLQVIERVSNGIPLTWRILEAPAIGVAAGSLANVFSNGKKYWMGEKRYMLAPKPIDGIIYRRKFKGIEKAKAIEYYKILGLKLAPVEKAPKPIDESSLEILKK